MLLHNIYSHRQTRKDLRNNATHAEKTLWLELKGNQMEGYKFRRQHGIGRYIVDFYCPSLKLIIEIDGAVHKGSEAGHHDTLREKELALAGFTILRFSNEDVLFRLNQVLSKIQAFTLNQSTIPS